MESFELNRVSAEVSCAMDGKVSPTENIQVKQLIGGQ